MKYFAIFYRNVATIFHLKWKIGNISDMFLQYSELYKQPFGHYTKVLALSFLYGRKFKSDSIRWMVICDKAMCLAVVLCDVNKFLVIRLVRLSTFSSVLAAYFLVFMASMLSCKEPVRRNCLYKLENWLKIDNKLSGSYIIKTHKKKLKWISTQRFTI